jgi:general secretion pathway protein F
MAAFHYRALNLDGGELSGVIEADTPRQARGALRGQGLFAVEVSAVLPGANTGAGAGKLSTFHKAPQIGGSALILLTRQWAALLEAGLPVERSLAALIEQSEDPAARAVLAGVRGEILAGHPLHAGLARFSTSFGPLYRALVEAGERSGQLSGVMQRLADNLETRGALRQKIIQALVYPVLVVIVASAVVLGLMTYVVPQVVSVFQNGKQALPVLTRALIVLSDFLRWSWPLLLLLIASAGWAARRALRIERLRRAWHGRLMRLPAVGRLLVSLDSARLAQTLAILVGSGVPLLAALEAGEAVLWLIPLREALHTATAGVREGQALHRALGASKRFPPFLVHMIASGEASGQLDILLEKAARQQQDEVSNRLAVAMGLLEPLLILGMGLVVLLIVLAVLQPIIEINQLLR